MTGTADPLPITPSELVQRYQSIYQQRMRELPLVNPRLAVAAVGFDPCQTQQRRLGVLVTPWFMNAVLLPDWQDRADWDRLPVGDTLLLRLPSGRYPFLLSHDEKIGCFRSCSLFSPMAEFHDQPTALATAQAALNALFEATPDPVHKNRKALSRRQFLRGDRAEDRDGVDR